MEHSVKIQTLALLDDRDKVSNWSMWWTRSQPIRNIAEIQAHIKILPVKHLHLYQKLAQRATELHLLGMPYSKIGKILGIDPKTVKKAILTNIPSPQRGEGKGEGEKR